MNPVALSESQSGLFDRWAGVYDTTANPLLMLEEQALPPLLPSITGQNVLDVGCGTGRWLAHLAALQPASLIGADGSAEMLRRARAKVPRIAHLLQTDAHALPVSDASQDFILCSFVLSYLQDLSAFASECARALKPGGYLLLSDMHPVTARQRGWTRSFAAEGETFRLVAPPPQLSQIITAFSRVGLRVTALHEPAFASEQRPAFEEAGRLESFLSLTDVPAIYLLKLRKPVRGERRGTVGPAARLQLTNARWSTGPSTWSDIPLSIEDGRIMTDGPLSRSAADTTDLSGYALLPGLINAHDHLEFALFPNLGRPPEMPTYANSGEWAREIHHRHAAIIADHSQVPLDTRVWWGAIRNLLCGVTTVCHHNRLHAELLQPHYPVRVVTRLGWGHSLAFEPNLVERFRDTPLDQPFVLHAAEGTDVSSSRELAQLDHMGLLERRTVIVHGLAFNAQDVALLNRRGASLVLCPTSNRYLFGRAPSSSFIRSVLRVTLGSDSPITAAGDLLDEIRCLRTEQQLDPHSLYRLVTASAAAILRLQQGEGHILQGGRADLIAVKDTGADPADILADLKIADIELVMISGRVQLASPAVHARLSGEQRSGLHLLQVAGIDRWIRAPLGELFHSAEQILGSGNLRVGGKQVRHRHSH